MKTISITALALTAMTTVFLVVLLVRRFLVERAENRRLEIEQRLRPLALELIAGGNSDLSGLSEGELEILSATMARYARSLTGEARTRITTYFETSGLVVSEIRSLNDRRSWRRANAAYLLGDMGSNNATQDLMDLLAGDPSREVRAAAARSLGKLQAISSVRLLLTALARRTVPRTVAAESILAIGPAALPALLQMADADEREMRAAAVELIGYVGDASCAVTLIDAMCDPGVDVRVNAARALGRLGAADGAAMLRAALADDSAEVRAAAASALGRIRDREAVDALLLQSTNDAFDAARAAAQALVQIDPRVVVRAASERTKSDHLLEAADMIALQAL